MYEMYEILVYLSMQILAASIIMGDTTKTAASRIVQNIEN